MEQTIRHASARRGNAFAKIARRAGVSVVIAAALLPVASIAQTTLKYTTSWVGNTFGFGDGKWIQLGIEGIAVGQDGTVYTNAPWDESGSEISAYKGGTKLAYAGQTHGWGNTGGDAIAVNGAYVYAAASIGNEGGKLAGSGYPANGYSWYGITRRTVANIAQGAPFASGVGNLNNPAKNSFLVVNAVPNGVDAAVRGLAATATELYVANTNADQVRVFDANTMAPLRSWSVPSPGRIIVDADGSLWIIKSLKSTPTVAHYSKTGAALPGTVALPSGAVPADIAIAPSGQLLVADSGPTQQLLVYSKAADGTTQPVTGMGTRGGIFAASAGVPGNWRLNGVTGIGFDKSGNLYIGQNSAGPRPINSSYTGEGTVLESYSWWTKALNWRVQGLLFVDGAAIDPASPNDVYTGSKHFKVNYGGAPGNDWTYEGFTLNRFRYPDDPAFHTTRGARGQPLVRRINGVRYLYTQDMYSHYLSIYRFNPSTDGEVAIPSGLISQNPIPGSWPVGQPSYGEWMWRDTNGDGSVQAPEIQANPATGNTVYNAYWWVDDAANVWLATGNSGIRKMALQGVDSVGNPIYSYSASKVYAMPQPFTRISRIVYDSTHDVMYISGYTSTAPYNSANWKSIGRVLARYDNWSSGTPSLQWVTPLAFDPSCSPAVFPVSLAAAGNYVFAAQGPTAQLDVYDARTGQVAGALKPDSTVGGTSGWIDAQMGISAAVLPTGQYVVLAEEDARAKVLVYRWTP